MSGELVPADGSETRIWASPAVPIGWTDADYEVDEDTEAEANQATARNTRRAYDRCWAEFENWCHTGTTDTDAEPVEGWRPRMAMPATGQTLATYANHLIKVKGLGPSSVNQQIAAVRYRHKKDGYAGYPDLGMARDVVKSQRKRRRGQQPHQAAALKPDQIAAMVATCNLKTGTGLRDRMVITLGIALMNRGSEIAALDIDEVLFVDQGLEVYIASSKTDQDAEGVWIPVVPGDNPDTCPVSAAADWITWLEEKHEITSGPLVRSTGQGGSVHDDRHVVPETISNIIRRRAKKAGLGDLPISSHSARATGATLAFDNGATPNDVATIGRWKATSPVMMTYWRRSNRWKDHPMRGAGL